MKAKTGIAFFLFAIAICVAGAWWCLIIDSECRNVFQHISMLLFNTTEPEPTPNVPIKQQKKECASGYLATENTCQKAGGACRTKAGAGGTWQLNKQESVICKMQSGEEEECSSEMREDYLMMGEFCPCDNIRMCEGACDSGSVSYHASRDAYQCAW